MMDNARSRRDAFKYEYKQFQRGVRQCVDTGAMSNAYYYTNVLCIACKTGNLHTLQRLVATEQWSREYIKTVDADGRTLLMIACDFGYLHIVQWLLKNFGHILDVNIRDKMDGRTAFMRACVNGHTHVVKWMANTSNVKEFKTDILALDLDERNAFLLACVAGHLEIAKLFVTLIVPPVKGSSPLLKTRDVFGHTAFMLACIYGHANVSEWLATVTSTADLLAVDHFGRTVLDRVRVGPNYLASPIVAIIRREFRKRGLAVKL